MTETDREVERILESYEQYADTVRFDTECAPNKEIVIEIIGEMRRVLFPGYFDEKKVRKEYCRYILGNRIEFIQYNLKKQVAKALCGECGCCEENVEKRAEEIVREFIHRIPKMREYLATDVQAIYDGDPAASSTEEIIFSYPGLFAVTVYRIAHELVLLGVPLIPRIMTEYAHSETGIDIHPEAKIGKYFCIDHGTGIVIGSSTEIGDYVKIYQGVTLGAVSTRHGQELHGVKRHPTIGNNVTIYSNATILGGETVIGDNVTIGGNAFITKSVSESTKVSIKSPEMDFVNGKGWER
ncbi:MAG: serine O-acetyltransferase [Clostridia bacterium]|nr:serine O-acetyltransferase [Clostridia bacterium]